MSWVPWQLPPSMVASLIVAGVTTLIFERECLAFGLAIG